MRYAVIVEEGESSFGAHVPDLPGCVAVADTKEEVLKLIQVAIEFHLEGLREENPFRHRLQASSMWMCVLHNTRLERTRK